MKQQPTFQKYLFALKDFQKKHSQSSMDQEEEGLYFLVFKFSGSVVEVLICSEMIGEVALALAGFFSGALNTE